MPRKGSCARACCFYLPLIRVRGQVGPFVWPQRWPRVALVCVASAVFVQPLTWFQGWV